MLRKVYTAEKWLKVNKRNKELLEDFVLEMKSNKKSPETIKQYTADLKMILVYIHDDLGNKDILELNKKDFRRIKMWFLDEREVSSARCCRVMSALHSMLDFAEDDDDYDYEYNKSKKVKGVPKESKREIIFLSDNQISKIRNHLIEKKKYKLLALTDIYYDSAGRRKEVLQIKKQNLLERNYTNIVRGKGGKHFPLLYFSRSKESLKLYLDSRTDDLDDLWVCYEGQERVREAKYSTLYEWTLTLREIISELEGKEIKITPHSFRHSAIENMKRGTHYICKELKREEGFPLEELKVYAHHEDTGTTEAYLKNDEADVLSNMFGIKLN